MTELINDENMNRRKFLGRLSLWLGAGTAALVSVPIIGALLDPVLKKKMHQWRRVGRVEEFAINTTSLVTFTNADPGPGGGLSEKTSAWLRRKSENSFIAFSVNCTHLGCPVRWEADAELFMCPCHGGVYHKNGSVAAGPPPKGLVQYMVRVADGYVEVKTAPVPLTDIDD